VPAVSKRLRARRALASLLMAVGGAAQASDVAPAVIGFLAPVRYAEQANVKARVRDTCELEKTLRDDILAALRASGRSVDPVASTDTGKVLEVVIQRVANSAGAMVLSVMARMYEDGKSSHLKMLSAGSRGGVNIFAGTCTLLQGDSSDLAGQLTRWLDELDRAGAADATPAAAR